MGLYIHRGRCGIELEWTEVDVGYEDEEEVVGRRWLDGCSGGEEGIFRWGG